MVLGGTVCRVASWGGLLSFLSCYLDTLEDPDLRTRVELAFRCTIATMIITTLAISLAGFFLLFRWNSMSCAFVHRKLKPSNI